MNNMSCNTKINVRPVPSCEPSPEVGREQSIVTEQLNQQSCAIDRLNYLLDNLECKLSGCNGVLSNSTEADCNNVCRDEPLQQMSPLAETISETVSRLYVLANNLESLIVRIEL